MDQCLTTCTEKALGLLFLLFLQSASSFVREEGSIKDSEEVSRAMCSSRHFFFLSC